MLIDAHVHLDKYGDRLDDALKEIENEQIFTVATAMDVPSYLELQRDRRSARIWFCRLSVSIRAAPPNMPNRLA